MLMKMTLIFFTIILDTNELSYFGVYCEAFASLVPRNDKCPANNQGGGMGGLGHITIE